MSTKTLKGDCECCETSKDVVLVVLHGMAMCPKCLAEQQSAEARQKSVEVIENAHTVDASLELKSDIFNSATVSFIELKAAIDNNPDIPASEKEYALVKEAAIRRGAMNQLIVAKKQELLKAQNEHFAWDKNIKDTVAKLRVEQRKKFEQFDLTYQPEPTSKKPKKVQAAKGYDRAAVNDAAVKYGVPTHGIQSILVSRPGMNPDAAAKELAKMLGLPSANL